MASIAIITASRRAKRQDGESISYGIIHFLTSYHAHQYRARCYSLNTNIVTSEELILASSAECFRQFTMICTTKSSKSATHVSVARIGWRTSRCRRHFIEASCMLPSSHNARHLLAARHEATCENMIGTSVSPRFSSLK